MLTFLDSFSNLRLDIVGFTAILGEASVLANAQVTFLSKFSFVPRLIPAPQALIRTTRPERLKPATGKVVGAYSGGIRDQINHVAHILNDGNSLPEYSVRCVEVTKTEDEKAIVKASSTGPVIGLALLGFFMSIALIVLSVHFGDGMALLATILLSVLSTIIGIGSKWDLVFTKRTMKGMVPPGDVVIKYPQGAFLIVKCKEEVARELYWAPEKCEYWVGDQIYRLISLAGTLMLMFAVIALSNAGLDLQLAFAAAYIVLNAAYWIVAALPQKLHWDLTSFHVETKHYSTGETNKTFTQALWHAIAITETTEWAVIADVAPKTNAWTAWLRLAENEVAEFKRDQAGVDGKGYFLLPEWDCQTALSDLHRPDPAAANV